MTDAQPVYVETSGLPVHKEEKQMLNLDITTATSDQSEKIVNWYVLHASGSKTVKGEKWNTCHRIKERAGQATCSCGSILIVNANSTAGD